MYDTSGISKQRIITLLVVVMLFVFGSMLARHVIIGQNGLVSLTSDPLYEPIALSLQKASDSKYLPILGKDYSTSYKYFDSDSYAIVSVEPINNSSDSVVIVLKKEGNSYVTVIPPTNDIGSNNLSGLPSNVVSYLKFGLHG